MLDATIRMDFMHIHKIAQGQGTLVQIHPKAKEEAQACFTRPQEDF